MSSYPEILGRRGCTRTGGRSETILGFGLTTKYEKSNQPKAI